jgi:hypothetical protein
LHACLHHVQVTAYLTIPRCPFCTENSSRGLIYFLETKCHACMISIKHCPVGERKVFAPLPLCPPPIPDPPLQQPLSSCNITLLSVPCPAHPVHPFCRSTTMPCSNRSRWKAGAIEIRGTREWSTCGVIRCRTGQRGCQFGHRQVYPHGSSLVSSVVRTR